MEIKFSAKGRKFLIDSGMFNDHDINIIYGGNGVGKSTLFESIQCAIGNEKINIEDQLNVLETDINELKNYFSGKKVLLVERNHIKKNLDHIIENEQIIISKNAAFIKKLRDGFKKYADDLSKKDGVIISNMLKELGDSSKANQLKTKQFVKDHGLKNALLKIDLSEYDYDAYGDPNVSVLKVFKNKSVFSQYVKFLEGLAHYFEISKDKVKELELKYNIDINNIDFYNWLAHEDTHKSWSSIHCPICLNKYTKTAVIKDISKELEHFNQSTKSLIYQLKQEYKDNDWSDILDWDDSIGISFQESVTNQLNEFRDIDFNFESKKLISKVLFLESILLQSEDIQEALDEQPIIDLNFKNSFEADMKSILAFAKHDFELKVSENRKELLINLKNTDIKLSKICSTSMLNLMSMLYILNTIKDEELIIFDDPTDSNDLLNTGIMQEKIMSLSKKHRIVILTHDMNFINSFYKEELNA